MDRTEKIQMLSNLIENELNGGCMMGNENQMMFAVASTMMHRSLQSELCKLIVNWIKFHAKMYDNEETRRMFYDGRNEWVGDMCSKIIKEGVICIWSFDGQLVQYAREEVQNTFSSHSEWSCLDCERIAKK